jgi:2-polyprenyl-3-methyl-5-hydroxy-6-metoxy-1,4-benzoquinol methylase
MNHELWKLYVSYFTHEDAKPRNSFLRSRYERVGRAYLARKYGYSHGDASLLDGILSRLLFFLPARKESFDAQVYYLSHTPSGRLLEIGCGSGTILKLMNDLGWDAEGLEIDPAAVTNAKSKGLRVRQQDILTSDLPPNFYDAVAMSHVIEHLDKTQETLGAILKTLKPGGKLVIATPNAGSLGHTFFGSKWFALEPPRHLRLFDTRNLRDLLLKSGFSKAKSFTTARGTSNIAIASSIIMARGRYNVEVASFPRKVAYRAAEILDGLEWLAIQYFKDRGEELVVIGSK